MTDESVSGVTSNDSDESRQRVKKAPTIYDVAELAGVNPSTVSRALSRPGRISARTETRVLAAAKELNYRLNPMARALPTGRTNTIGLVVADITNPVFFDVIRGAERAAMERGYVLVLVESQESGELEAAAAQRVLPSVDALILVTSRLAEEKIRDLSSRKPVVVLNRDVAEVPSIVPSVSPGIDDAVEHLHALDHTSVAFLSGPSGSWMSAARWDRLFEIAPRKGMAIVEIPSSAPTLEGGKRALSRIVASGVTAVFAYNDLMAIGLLLEATATGIAIPDDLSIIGFDDSFGSDFTTPPLTTIRTPLDVLGERAVERALTLMSVGESMNEAEEPPLMTELVVRGSTASVSV